MTLWVESTVDPKLVDLSRIDDETRYRIFDYLWSNGRISSSDLGITPSMANKIKNRKARISDRVLAKLIEHLSPEEYARLVGAVPPIENVSLELVINVLRAALAKPELRYTVIQYVLKELGEEIRSYTKFYQVSEEDIRRFEKALRFKAEKTRADRMRYLYRALKDLNFVLSPERLNEYILELMEESPNVARHVASTLKLFIKYVVMPKDRALGIELYNSFKVPNVKHVPTAVLTALGMDVSITLEDIKKVAQAIDDPAARAAFVLLAETGLRPGEVFSLTLDQVDIEKRVVKPLKIAETKRAYLTFFTEVTKKFLKEVYLPYREKFLKHYLPAMKNLGIDTGSVENSFFPFKEQTLRQRIREAMLKALGRTFDLYELRRFFASWLMKKGVQESIINLFQGRLGRKDTQVLMEHYLKLGIEELRRIYDENMYCVLC